MMKFGDITGGIGLGVICVGISLAAGCGYVRQARDTVQPAAVPAMMASQTLNPEAGRNRKVVAGLDGAAAKNVGDAYSKSFERRVQTGSTEGFQGLSGLAN